jgi:hypothetical protein
MLARCSSISAGVATPGRQELVADLHYGRAFERSARWAGQREVGVRPDVDEAGRAQSAGKGRP